MTTEEFELEVSKLDGVVITNPLKIVDEETYRRVSISWERDGKPYYINLQIEMDDVKEYEEKYNFDTTSMVLSEICNN